MGLNVTIFMGKMDVKYMWMKCSHGTKRPTVGLAKNVWTECSAVTFRPQKMFKTKCSGVDEQSVHLEIKCHSGRSEHLDIVLGGRSEGVKTLLGRFKHEHFVKAPSISNVQEFGPLPGQANQVCSHITQNNTRNEYILYCILYVHQWSPGA